MKKINKKSLFLRTLDFRLQKGFTLIEVIAAMFVITVGVVGALIAIQQTMFYTQASVLRLTATYLAQEGVEIVRNIRDGNWLELSSWDANLAAGDWEGDYTMDQNLDVWTDRYLRINGGFYQYSSGTSTPFKRKIEILNGEPDKMKVEVTVEWEEIGKPRQVIVEEYLYDWKKRE